MPDFGSSHGSNMKKPATTGPGGGWYRFRYRVGRLLPHWFKRLLYPFVPWRPRTTSPNVSNVESFQLAPHVKLDVYWLKLPNAAGPAASFYVHDDEVMRLDCLGKASGHLHINMKQLRAVPSKAVPRFFFFGQTHREQIDEAAHHLERNLEFCLQTNINRRVRSYEPDDVELANAIEFLRFRMAALLEQNETAGRTPAR